MRDKFYYAFGLVLIGFILFFAMLHDLRWFIVISIPLAALYLYDVIQTKHSILRNFPILGHIRYVFEFIRPEIQQYFIADDLVERPFNREARSLIYARAKKVRDTIPFGTRHDLLEVGYDGILHSLNAKHPDEVEKRIIIGNEQCGQPYSSSHLNISGMSFGALSANAVMAMNLGAKIGGFAQATGEGGLSPYHLQGGDVIWQIGTAYFGCRNLDGTFNPDYFAKDAQRPEVKMIELKLSQGAKPSHGGILPAAKLTKEIAEIRKVPMGQDVFSPPTHSAFGNPIEMMHFIQKLRELSGGKPVGFKLCIGHKKEFLSICKGMLATGIVPDFITVDGAEGGTGAAPVEFVNRVGMPLAEGLAFVQNAMMGVGLRNKVCIAASGKISTGFTLAAAMGLGADVCNAARAMMLATGCVQSLQCNANTCPTGVTTHDKRLQKGLVVEDKKYRVANFHAATIHSFYELVGAMGLTSPSDITPDHIYKRISPTEIRTYRELYHFIPEGSLLGNNIPVHYAEDWANARADVF
ncbi:MAG: glutamate synthase [Gammaproteobacteria bacterium RIFCSPHIGHO2_12_FULL_42_13]|nr:MAG: glutamate synthase [Gammaproteobacteria bacterium RIFCSPHIGHO2_12_FULL_42_13]